MQLPMRIHEALSIVISKDKTSFWEISAKLWFSIGVWPNEWHLINSLLGSDEQSRSR